MLPLIDPDAEDPRAELDWIAFRYLAGDLSEAERLAFDERMADDQQAREALAAAVELAGAVRLAEAGRKQLPAAWPRWAVLAAAASIVAAFWLASAPTARTSAGEVALAWSDLRQADYPGDDPADVPREDEAVECEQAEDVPAWLFDVLESPTEPAL
ncbi:MAG: hypothetical protein U0800_21990 [Isosphaeraceae bacterium]